MLLLFSEIKNHCWIILIRLRSHTEKNTLNGSSQLRKNRPGMSGWGKWLKCWKTNGKIHQTVKFGYGHCC